MEAYNHHTALLEEAVTVLNRYTPFSSQHRVTFSQRPDGRLAGHLERTDGTPFSDSALPLDRKLAQLKDQTAVIRPFFLAMSRTPWDESTENVVAQVDCHMALPRNHVAALPHRQGQVEHVTVVPHIVRVVTMPAVSAGRIVVVGVELT